MRRFVCRPRACHQSRRMGFTLIELLVVIAIIALLMALLLPAIQKVREAANKMLCASNMRQIMIATHNYHNDYNKLPPGYYGPLPNNAPAVGGNLNNTNGSHVGILAILLPYLEADNVFKLFQPYVVLDLKKNGEAWWSLTPSPGNTITYNAARTVIKGYLCPSDDAGTDIADATGYPAGSGTNVVAVHMSNTAAIPISVDVEGFANGSTGSPETLGRTNYVAVSGMSGSGTNNSGFPLFFQWSPTLALGSNSFVGVFTNRGSLTLGQLTVQDGTSNTIGLAEVVGGRLNSRRLYNLSWMGVGAGGLWQGLQRGNVDHSPFNGSSKHTAGINATYCDGSVRTLRYGTSNIIPNPANPAGTLVPPNIPQDWYVLMTLVGRKDGVQIDLSSLVD